MHKIYDYGSQTLTKPVFYKATSKSIIEPRVICGMFRISRGSLVKKTFKNWIPKKTCASH